MISVVWLVISIFGNMGNSSPQQTAKNQQADICGADFDIDISHDHSLSSAVANFAQKMYLHIASKTNDDNFVFSPLSLHSALTLLYLGTTPDSTTKREMERAMGLLSNPELLQGLYKNVVNSYKSQKSFLYGSNIWIQEDFNIKTCYKKRAISMGAGVENISFDSPKSVEKVNEWVQRMTNDKIKQIVESFSSDTKLFIANALYFNDKWLQPFNDFNDFGQKLETEFQTLSGSRRLAPFITQTSGNLIYGKITYGRTDMEVITIPYTNQDFEMQIILPNNVRGLKFLEGELQQQEDRDLSNRESGYFNIFLKQKNITKEDFTKIQLTMPTFQVETKINAVEALEKFGAVRVFTPEAELDNLSSSGPLGVSNIVHKAVIEVNEDGTEGAAATGIELVLLSGFDAKKYIVVDRPFIFIVQDKVNNIPVLVGRVGDPTIVTKSSKSG